MTSKYFSNCFTLDELKKEYKKLMQKYHPDVNKNGLKQTQEINSEYDIFFEKLKNTHKNAQGEFYTKETTETVNEYKDIINKIIHFQNVKIEIIGSWIWISENTLPYKDILKELNFKWSKNKKAWYYHNMVYFKKSKNQFDMDGLRNIWGSEEVETQKQQAIA